MGIIGGAIGAIVVARNVKRTNDAMAAAPAAWQPLVDGGLELGRDDEGRPKLAGTIGGVAVLVRLVADMKVSAHTRVIARLPAKGVERVGVYPSPAGLLGKVRSMIGQDILIGDETFDEEFLITAKPESAATKLLSPELRGLLTALAGGNLGGFNLRKRTARIQLQGVELDPEVLDVALEAVVLAAGGRV